MPKHIIFMLSDQHNPKVIGQYDPYVHTPNLDRLAEHGTSFSNCYCPSPICVPSRIAMLTGQLPSKTGVINNQQALSSDTATFAHSLGIAGYETVLCGRMHFNGPDQRHGFQQRLVGDMTPTIVGGPDSNHSPALTGTSGQSRVAVEKSGAGNSNVMVYDKAVRDAACQFINGWDEAKPLFLLVGFYGPHCPYVCPESLFKYYYDRLPEPDLCEEFKQTVHPAIKKFYELRGLSDLDPDDVKRARAAYYGLVELIDRYVGNIVEAVEQRFSREDTLIVYASDHGDMLGEKGLFWKTNFYDGSARVPMIFSQPGTIPEGKEIRQVTSLLDLAPTLLDMGNAPELPEMDGENLLPLLSGAEPENPRRAVISQLGDIKGDSPSATIRQGPWKLVSHYGYEQPQLFNMDDDPEELRDLAGQPKYADIQADLQARLNQQWDGEQFVRIDQRSIAHQRVLMSWVQATNAQEPEHWKGDPAENYLLW
ncbi:MAG: sulfatase-like hydrolase/transferase [bacterium]|nr:sulfatase-like hydrolase/transferase [bacterium]